MYAGDPQLTASQVLQTFRHDELYLFLGAAVTTVGLMSAAFSFLRRKFDAMLFWLALSAILYGLRLWLQLDFFSLLVPPTDFFRNLRIAGNYLVPIPALFFFEAAGFLGRHGRKIAIALTVPFLCLFVGTFLLGPKDVFDLINNLIVILSLIALAILSFTRKNSDRDFIIIRLGIAVFIAFALYETSRRARETTLQRTDAFASSRILGCSRSACAGTEFNEPKNWKSPAVSRPTSALPPTLAPITSRSPPAMFP
jgi:sigma-B regulation protein RsbU (phosphoserine phosphatase)